MRNQFKAIAQPLCAALALLAVGAGSALAAAPEFHAESAPVITEGSSTKGLFELNGGVLICKKVEAKGTNTTTTTTTSIFTPTASECTAFGRAATVDTNNCQLIFHLVAGSSPPTATVDVTNCASGMVVTVPSLPCNVTVPAQNGLKHVTFANEGAGATRDNLVTVSVSGIKYTENGAGCLGEGVGTQQSNGKLTGTGTVKGFQDSGGVKGAQQGIWVE